MDNINYDLISDLNLEDWPGDINWDGVQTSLLAVVAGDVSRDLDRVVHELTRISENYRQVIYIDGDLENSDYQGDEAGDYIERKLKKVKNCLYLRSNVVVFNNVAFVGANLWWVPWGRDITEDEEWLGAVDEIARHHKDLNYLKHSIHRMQMTNDVHKVVVVSHTVPNTALIEPFPDINLENIGSNASEFVGDEDMTNKITTWSFGHYHRPIDEVVGDIRYVSNPRGKPENNHGFRYFPKRISIV